MARKGRGCASFKTPYRNERLAALGARRLARHLNRNGFTVTKLYHYQCKCGALHLTRRRSFFSEQNLLTFTPVDEELQVALMTEEARAAYLQRLDDEREGEYQELLRRLPEPPASGGRYTNTPKGRRHG